MMTRFQNGNPRAGFTLVEMLVSVAIISLMMVLFAEIFALSAQSVGTQKGIGRNDQRTRVLMNVLRADLENRTFRTVFAFGAGEIPASITAAVDPDGNFDFGNRRGYVYISENDPNSGDDDVLQFTIEIPDGDNDLLFGRAELLDIDGDGNVDLTNDRNQPGLDDGQTSFVPPTAGDRDIGTSRFAEVSYFVRNGTLYRRVLLLREPLDSTATANPGDLANPWVAGSHTGSFYEDFDYSVHFDTGSGAAEFHDNGWLDNDSSVQADALGQPQYRFGHDHATGQPREFVNPGAPSRDGFLGRYTHAETSSATFLYPDDASSGAPANPMDRSDLTGISIAPGSRVGEDILMQNVHSFDIKVWDDQFDPTAAVPPRSAADKWVDIGHAEATGSYRNALNAQITYGPSTFTIANADDPEANRVFDTWHPGVNVTGGGPDAPPFRPGGDAAPQPLRAIQITVRFFDTRSGQLRQATFRHALFSNRQ